MKALNLGLTDFLGTKENLRPTDDASGCAQFTFFLGQIYTILFQLLGNVDRITSADRLIKMVNLHLNAI